MLVMRHRLVIAGAVTAAAIAVPAAGLAAGSGSPSAKPSPSRCAVSSCPAKTSKAPGAKSAASSKLGGLAASAGLTADQLRAGLIAAKQAGGNTAAGTAAFVASTGVSQATAQRILRTVFGTQVNLSLTGPAAVRTLSAHLGISAHEAHSALERIGALGGRDGLDPTSPAFAAIAHDLGVSPAELAAALDAVKRSMAGR